MGEGRACAPREAGAAVLPVCAWGWLGSEIGGGSWVDLWVERLWAEPDTAGGGGGHAQIPRGGGAALRDSTTLRGVCSARLSVTRRVGIGSLSNSIMVRRLLCGERSLDVGCDLSAAMRYDLCVKCESTADVALPSVLPGCCVRDRFPAEAWPGLLGSSG